MYKGNNNSFPYKVGDLVSTPDLIGGVTGILVEVEKLSDPLEQRFKGKVQCVRDHRIKLAIIQTANSSWEAGTIAEFWPKKGATWKKL